MQGRLNNTFPVEFVHTDLIDIHHSFTISKVIRYILSLDFLISVKLTFDVLFHSFSSVAEEMARLHTLPVPSSWTPGETRPSYFIQFYKMLKLLPSEFPDPAQNKR